MTTAPAMPDFSKTVDAVVIRSSVWLGIRRIFNDLQSLKNKCKNLPKIVDSLTITAYRRHMNKTTIELTRNDEVELSIGFSNVPVKVADLVNEDGTVTASYWEFWKSFDGAGRQMNKQELRDAGLGVRKSETGRWVIPHLAK